ncbi:neutral zinc metallopeptidase [Flavobacterium sp. CYK-55]|uniref:KPN_02809 family neutral zinc metallopeptidase n=1 Tax=Flavobacterium sp. CYK-55 TaxID=2835529 RepID=UPI001BD02DD0|nr:neutral zinc metallopeptidase [Flavobacterium sp. CYK-55]MBS7787743.1 neutral zinc metallopeptidase [Flavobacterium sp. CYK-55]
MKWIGRRQSENMEDRRGVSGGKVAVGGGIIGIIILLINLLGGENTQQLTPVLEQLKENQAVSSPAQELSQADREMGEFCATVLADTEDVWSKIFQENGLEYQKPKMVLFTDAVQTGCGSATAASGPFYCPADQKLYMDLAFFEELKTRFGAQGGDFAIAYVIAHEVGHHVQNLLGTSDKTHQQQQQKSEAQANKLSVALELQADFYAGVFTHYDQKYNQVLEAGDIEEALSAAQAVGDDAIQKRMQGQVVPDSFTHGTSQQRMKWFTRGFESGDMQQGNTFQELLNVSL